MDALVCHRALVRWPPWQQTSVWGFGAGTEYRELVAALLAMLIVAAGLGAVLAASDSPSGH